jgi:drug/metabolite transporter (DMT)-like permease
LALAINAGDALALASGIAWSLGLLVIFRRAERPIGEQIAAQAAGAIVVAVMVAAFGLTGHPAPSAEQFAAALPSLLFVAILLTIPMWCLSLWASRHLTPARTTLLFMIEVCIGVGSAAVLSGDPFGWREAAGTVLVISAAFVELKQPPQRPVDTRSKAADLI